MLPPTYKATPLDEIIPPLYYGIIFAFSCDEKQRDGVLEALQGGFTKLIQLWPYLGGDIVRNHDPSHRPGSLGLNISRESSETKISVADLSNVSSGWNHSYDDLLKAGIPLSWLDAALFAPYVGGTATITKPVMGQINWVPGGCLLTVSISHAVMDAWGASVVIRYWSQLCQESQGVPQASSFKIPERASSTKKTLTPFSESSGSVEFGKLKARSELWKLLGLHWEDNLAPSDGPSLPVAIPAAGVSIPGMRTGIFCFSRQACARLKKDLTPLPGDHWISTKDALTALIWRGVMRARFYDNMNIPRGPKGAESTSIVTVAVNGRSLFKPELPETYINNVVYCCMNELPLSEVLGKTPLASLASTIRRRIETVKSDTALIHDANTLASCIPDVGKLTFAFKDFLGFDLITSSWIDLPFYDVDFGPVLGKPDLIRVPRDQFGGLCCLLPRKPNGDVEVFISLKGDEMERLLGDVDFSKYASFVCE